MLNLLLVKHIAIVMDKIFESKTREVLKSLGIQAINPGASTGINWLKTTGDITSSYTPIDGSEIARVTNATAGDYEFIMKTTQEAFLIWKKTPAPARGEVVRKIG